MQRFTVKLELYIDVCESFSAKDFAEYQPFSAAAYHKPKNAINGLEPLNTALNAAELYFDVREASEMQGLAVISHLVRSTQGNRVPTRNLALLLLGLSNNSSSPATIGFRVTILISCCLLQVQTEADQFSATVIPKHHNYNPPQPPTSTPDSPAL